jgi:translation initiation factor 6 (eIF-6)
MVTKAQKEAQLYVLRELRREIEQRELSRDIQIWCGTVKLVGRMSILNEQGLTLPSMVFDVPGEEIIKYDIMLEPEPKQHVNTIRRALTRLHRYFVANGDKLSKKQVEEELHSGYKKG